jgi:hypothetical protein
MPTRSCFQKLFVNATKNDILVFTLGMPYAFENALLDMDRWITSSAAAFRSHLTATFPGKIFRFTNAQTLKHVASMTPILHHIDYDLLWPVWYPSADEENSWFTIDQWAINENRNHYYNDHVHFNGPLTHAMLTQVLNLLCPDLGLKADYFHDLETHLIQVDRKSTSLNEQAANTAGTTASSTASSSSSEKNEIEFYIYERKADTIHLIPKECLPYLKTRNTFDISDTEIKLMKKGADFPPFLCEEPPKQPKVVRPVSSRSVYLVENRQKRIFNSGEIFEKKGFEWNQIVVIEDWAAEMIPDGSPMR